MAESVAPPAFIEPCTPTLVEAELETGSAPATGLNRTDKFPAIAAAGSGMAWRGERLHRSFWTGHWHPDRRGWGMGETDVEAVRSSFRPAKIATLFVGESAPVSGDFFYYGTSAMTRYIRLAVKFQGSSKDFLEWFKSQGWYLDDLVLKPINHLTPSERRAQWKEWQPSLESRIEKYKPTAIVTLLRGIEQTVRGAAKYSDATMFVTPFPGMGRQRAFAARMEVILPQLPRVMNAP